MDDAALTALAQELAADQASDQQKMAQLDQMAEVMRLALAQATNIKPVAIHAIQTMEVIRVATKLKMDAVTEFLRAVDAERRG